ncbi:hypothetical protein CsSME_00045854 [Camellia sinensis var. sinensis]
MRSRTSDVDTGGGGLPHLSSFGDGSGAVGPPAIVRAPPLPRGGRCHLHFPFSSPQVILSLCYYYMLVYIYNTLFYCFDLRFCFWVGEWPEYWSSCLEIICI